MGHFIAGNSGLFVPRRTDFGFTDLVTVLPVNVISYNFGCWEDEFERTISEALMIIAVRRGWAGKIPTGGRVFRRRPLSSFRRSRSSEKFASTLRSISSRTGRACGPDNCSVNSDHVRHSILPSNGCRVSVHKLRTGSERIPRSPWKCTCVWQRIWFSLCAIDDLPPEVAEGPTAAALAVPIHVKSAPFRSHAEVLCEGLEIKRRRLSRRQEFDPSNLDD